jgi:hypothetical protein
MVCSAEASAVLMDRAKEANGQGSEHPGQRIRRCDFERRNACVGAGTWRAQGGRQPGGAYGWHNPMGRQAGMQEGTLDFSSVLESARRVRCPGRSLQ